MLVYITDNIVIDSKDIKYMSFFQKDIKYNFEVKILTDKDCFNIDLKTRDKQKAREMFETIVRVINILNLIEK